ncbi:MAG: PASTA domain-containing protein [Oscillospiraceae bacterium]|nr:PASTA domain-containing protein [Oscillospiraceae bacterium]
MIKCPNCGEIIKEKKSKMNFCGYCGTNLKTGEKSWVPKEPDTPAELPVNNTPVQTAKPAAVSVNTQAPAAPDVSTNNFRTVSPVPQPAPQQPAVQAQNPSRPYNTTQPPVSTAGSFSDIQSSIMMSEVAESIAKDTQQQPEQPSVPISERKTSAYLSNVKLRSSNDSSETDGGSLTYMEYTKNGEEQEENEPAVQPKEEKPAVETPAPEIKETVVPKTELISSYFGQDKLTVENMLRFKGFVVKSVYVTNDALFDTIVDQSVAAGSEAEIGSEIVLSVSAGTWSEWKDKPDLNITPQKYITEKKQVYRSRVRKRTMETRETNDLTGFQEYAVIDTKHKYSEWKTDTYYTSEILKQSDVCEVISKATGFKYAGWFNPQSPADLSYSSPDLARFFNSVAADISWEYDEVISEFNIKPDVKNWHLLNDSMSKTPAGDSLTSNIFLSTHIIGNKAYAMKFGSAETVWYIYKRRSILETTYQVEREVISGWSEWTKWTDEKPEETEDTEVESKTVCRSRHKNSQEL